MRRARNLEYRLHLLLFSGTRIVKALPVRAGRFPASLQRTPSAAMTYCALRDSGVESNAGPICIPFSFTFAQCIPLFI